MKKCKLGHRIWDLGYRMWDVRCGIWDVGYWYRVGEIYSKKELING